VSEVVAGLAGRARSFHMVFRTYDFEPSVDLGAVLATLGGLT
jgi:hypothetical protein